MNTTVETATGPSGDAETNVTVHPGTGSDTLDIALLSAGLLLLLSAAFYGRISEIDLPGGFALKLNAEQLAALRTKAKAEAPDSPVQQRQLVSAAVLELSDAAADHQQQLLDEAFNRAKDRASKPP